MDLGKLSCLCRWLNLSVSDFNLLRGLSEDDIWRHLILVELLKESWNLQDSKKHLQNIFNMANEYLIIYPGHAHYPKELMELAHPPVFLNMVGDVHGIHVYPKLAIVGARDIEFRHQQWMEEHLAFFCQNRSACLVSGGARGVDQKVTHVAEKYEYPHLVFLPSGLGCPYPIEMKNYFKRKNIAIISEYFPKEKMQKGHFVSRNRLISGVSDCVFIVQAAQKSGTMITAKYAIEQNKEVAVLPDFPGHMKSSGNLLLLKDGAHMILKGEDLVQLLQTQF